MKVSHKLSALLSALALGAGLALIATPASAQWQQTQTGPVNPPNPIYVPWTMSGIYQYGNIGDCPDNSICLYSGQRLSGKKLAVMDLTPMTALINQRLHGSWIGGGLYSSGTSASVLSIANATRLPLCVYNANGKLTLYSFSRSAFNNYYTNPGDAYYIGVGFLGCPPMASDQYWMTRVG